MKMNRVLAIFEKDFKEYFRNMSLFTTMILPIFMALLFANINLGVEAESSATLPTEIVYLVIGMTFAAVMYNGMATMMSEENEKGTLRGLIQSPATLTDIIVGKSLVVVLMTFVSLIVSIVIMTGLASWPFRSIIGILLLGLFFLALGLVVGLLVKSVATTAVYTMPIMFIFGFTPYIEFIVQNPEHTARRIADKFPLYQAMNIHQEINVASSFVILTGWVVAALLLTVWAFKKRSKDD